MRKLLIFISMCLTISFVSAQVDLNIVLEDEDLSEESKQELLEQLEDIDKNIGYSSLNLNTLTKEQMILLGLNNFQIFSLQNYIKNSGQILSLNELHFINGFDEQTIQRISPFVYAERVIEKAPLNLDSIFKHSKNTLRFQYKESLHKPFGYTRTDDKGYLGEKFSSSLRYKMKYYDRMEFSFVADKDAGEPLRYKGKTFGYDHYNIAFSLYDIGKHIKQVTLGDYRLSLGEGLAMKQTFDIGYFSNYGIKSSTGKISPFRSTSEYNYNKGIALLMNFKNVDIFLFGSYNFADFNGKSLQQTGYHRTTNELNYKDSISQTLFGTSIQYVSKGLQLGTTILNYHFSDSIAPNVKSYPYQQYYFSGKDNAVFAFNASYTLKRLLFFSEIAQSSNKGKAYILGTQYNFNYKTALTLSYRNYDKDFQNHYANAIGIHSMNNNERGIYADFSHYISKKFSYYIGADLFYFPFISYRASKDVKGQKAKLQINYNINKNNSLLLHCRYTNRYYDYKIDNNTKIPFANTIAQTHLQYKFAIEDDFSFTLRGGYSRSFTHESQEQEGKFIFFEGMYNIHGWKTKFRVRYTLFNTMDYDNRFYVYEHSLPLSYSSSMLYGRGQSVYALLSWQISKYFELFLRYSLIRYSDREEISSDNDKISKNNNQFISGQILWKF